LRNPWPEKEVAIYRNGQLWKRVKGKLLTFETRPGDNFTVVQKGANPEKFRRKITASTDE
jgi:hypothetical protein